MIGERHHTCAKKSEFSKYGRNSDKVSTGNIVLIMVMVKDGHGCVSFQTGSQSHKGSTSLVNHYRH